mmetsp:Transcript_100937/g.290250  ORF Transcript_100937/g.290250 Transcript_100937/m.290250 type:complete len:218 (-) Transcript_100937:2482-3135(-)
MQRAPSSHNQTEPPHHPSLRQLTPPLSTTRRRPRCIWKRPQRPLQRRWRRPWCQCRQHQRQRARHWREQTTAAQHCARSNSRTTYGMLWACMAAHCAPCFAPRPSCARIGPARWSSLPYRSSLDVKRFGSYYLFSLKPRRRVRLIHRVPLLSGPAARHLHGRGGPRSRSSPVLPRHFGRHWLLPHVLRARWLRPGTASCSMSLQSWSGMSPLWSCFS